MTGLESPNCPLCNSSTFATIFEGERFDPYAVKRCAHCGLHFLSPRLQESAMLKLYSQEHYFSGESGGYSDYAAQEPALRATFRRLLQSLARRGLCGGSLLEIGCGHGFLLDEAKPYFERRVGTDFSMGAVQLAQGKADNVFHGGIDSVAGVEVFDCVIATHVIEHVYQPKEFIASLLARLRPGGSLLIAAPDMGSYWRKLMGRRWPSFKLPEHILYFDRHTLTKLLVDAGVQNTVEIPYPHAFPLPLIASKLGIALPHSLDRFSFWLPGTTVAIAGVKGNDR